MKFQLCSLCVMIVCFAACKNDTPREKKEVKEYTIEQLYNNNSVFSYAFNADESKLLINSNITGVQNIYELNISDTTITPLTTSVKDSYYSIDYLPGTNDFLYTADSGGNENRHIYLQRKGSTAKDITPWKGSQNNMYGWSDDKKSMYVSSNRRDPKYFDILKLDTMTWAPVMLFQNDSGFSPEAISKSERYIALVKEVTADKNDLYLYDRVAKTSRKLSSEQEATWFPAAFEKNDSVLYYTTNDGSEYSYLVKYSINSGTLEKVYETNWDVSGMNLSENEKYHTIFINEDGKNKLLLFDHATNKQIEFPAIEDGDVRNLTISLSEQNILLTVGSSRSPNNLYVYNFDSKKMKQVTQTLNKEVNPDDMVTAEVVKFKSFDGKEIPAIYYKPHKASKENKVPGMLWIHGGPGGQSRINFSNDIQFLVNHGYAVLAVNNRGSSGYGKSFYKMDNKDHSNGDLKDCVWGKKWLQQQDYIDTARIGIEGGSYGGCMVLTALAFHPNEFKVGVDLFGVTNWIRTLKSIPPYWEAFKISLYDEMGDPYTADSVRLKKASPLFNYEKINKPLLVFQGMNDVRVLPVESQEIVDGVRKNNVPVEYVTYANEGHGFTRRDNQMKTAKTTLAFLDKYLKGHGVADPKAKN